MITLCSHMADSGDYSNRAVAVTATTAPQIETRGLAKAVQGCGSIPMMEKGSESGSRNPLLVTPDPGPLPLAAGCMMIVALSSSSVSRR